MKYYFFRDVEHEDNLYNGKTYHSAGYVDKLFSEIGFPSNSGKDASATYFQPFEGDIMRQWRSFDEIELFEVSEYEYKALVEVYNKIEKP